MTRQRGNQKPLIKLNLVDNLWTQAEVAPEPREKGLMQVFGDWLHERLAIGYRVQRN